MHILPAYDMVDFNNEINNILTEMSLVRDFVTRVEKISRYFMGCPYLLGALGEGPQGYFDQSPLYRTDKFDCLTYVNTVLALARSTDLPQFQQEILSLNYYAGKPLYEQRLHFMEVDWNVENARRGIINDITQELMHDTPPIFAEAVIDKPNWFRHLSLSAIKLLTPLSDVAAEQRLLELHELAGQQQCVISRLAYIPLEMLLDSGEAAQQILARIPHGAILEIVRPNWDLREFIGTRMNISHLGFVFWQHSELLFRHASSSAKGGVLTVKLLDYLQACLAVASIRGVNVQKVTNVNIFKK